MTSIKILMSYIALISVSLLLSCQSKSEDPQLMNAQGVFDFTDGFMGDDDDEGEIPDYLNPDDILCNGKGLKVGRCISKQLKKGICLGIIKHEKRVYAIEIPCETVKKEEVDTSGIIATPQ